MFLEDHRLLEKLFIMFQKMSKIQQELLTQI